MSVYVDRMAAKLGRLVLCHMLADTSEELHAMADRLELKRSWCQSPGTYREHYDVSKAKRALAVRYGAVEVSRRELADLLQRKRPTGEGSGGCTGRARRQSRSSKRRSPKTRQAT